MRERLINAHERHQVESALTGHPVFCTMTESERCDLLGAVVSLEAIAEPNGRFAAAMLEHTSCRLEASLNQVDFFTDSSAEQRVAAFLLQLRSQQNSQEVRLPCRQKQVALLLGVREETVSRVLNDFRREGVLASRRSPIGLLDVDFLEQLVGPERAHLQLGAF